MQFKNLAILAAAGTAVAEFAIITTPIPTNLGEVLTNADGYASSVLNEVSMGLASLTQGSALSAAASAHKGLASFVATASYSIPSEVTKVGALETFSETPAWYSALPSDIKSYYDSYNAEVQRLVNQAILGENGTTASTTRSGSGGATGASASSGPSETGAAMGNMVGMMGAGVAAAFAGVMAL
ncbi:unnamed protein product [Alternaria alternata]|jgi:hypothetical protein|uniref:Uncharacterized protein n=3 Tax=Alternaria sect. Alternaria TaxID=2499237 RepID=A0A177DI22_ALTAL|nr:hypothetical protein CC77DRAFT_192210 [Alternaria alternata]XP_028510488.1 hypothetical protein AA0111_g1511 [Alternaria arborescens]XP_051592194.1 uncharacterized protein J4E82_001529 [Alternaria postmessia]RII12734.1 hypothetical protein CUC08_Gglean004851 [Alternaria sp. MG1]RYN32702.1 hypothetical protein AA0115_g3522 [Alternaria tenuissima]KAH6863925.1 hypothetical protein B0T12DRAFT_452028 [Alternaria alternata]KAI5379491.1 hypothetical protein J4E82_001529 [Alternaria postmessia]OA